MTDRRLIEDSFPLAEISEASTSERGKKGYPNKLHLWWARRPVAACRAAVFAALTASSKDKRKLTADAKFVARLSTWAVAEGLKPTLLRTARERLRASTPDGRKLRVLDPFAGGGAIPLEAQRLGCEAYSTDLNPVAHVIQRATLVYPQRLFHLPPLVAVDRKQLALGEHRQSRLVQEVIRWSEILGKRVKNRIDSLYPGIVSGERTPVSFLWARTIRCSNPACRSETPLVRSWWLSKRGPRDSVAVKPIAKPNGKLHFKIQKGVGIDFDPSKSTVSRGTTTCLFCDQVSRASYVKEVGTSRGLGERLMAEIYAIPGSRDKRYRVPSREEEAAVLELTYPTGANSAGVSWLPNESLPLSDTRAIFVHLYGYKTWGMLFNPRQANVLVAMCTELDAMHEEIRDTAKEDGLALGTATDLADAVSTYLALMVDRVADFGSRQSRWRATDGERTTNAFGRQALPMVWDYAETYAFNPFNANWEKALRAVVDVLDLLPHEQVPAVVQQASADRLPFEDGYFDAVVTDPPYYDAVPYSDLSDFFYVWMRRSIGRIFPDVFGTPLTPKRAEIVENPAHNKDKTFFEIGMQNAFAETNRVLSSAGIMIVIFAHKSTSAWETLLKALLHSGFLVSASWPVETEKRSRMRANASAALASSVFIVCRKRSIKGDGFLDDVEPALQVRLHERLDYFGSSAEFVGEKPFSNNRAGHDGILCRVGRGQI